MSLRFALLYAALLMGANPVLAETTALEALRVGEMTRMALATTPKPASQAEFTDPSGGSHSLADYQGKVVLLNFWSVSCVPCREEMPALNALERDLGGDDFAVVPIAFGYNHPAGLNRFLERYEIDALPILLDPKRAVSSMMGVIAPPVTMLLDRNGNEIGRLIGGADWSSPEAHALIEAAISAD
ncbi:MAG: TlpA disulfide reductase family protein [Maritimibacter sp.]